MSDRRALLVRLAPAGLLVLLVAAWLLPTIGGLRLASGDPQAADAWTAALDALPDEPTVLVGFDPDLGTYAEIRPTVRVAIADLLNRDARLVFVSLTPEGRALLLSELGRMERAETNPTRQLDLGFQPGAEAALVSLSRDPVVPPETEGLLARTIADEGIAAVDAVVIVGGNDIGPRSWVEQFQPRVPPMPMLAIAPTTLLPELQPYTETGQLAALLGTTRDGAAYREAAELGPLDRLRETPELPAAAMAIGIVAAILVLGQAWVARVASQLRDAGPEPGRDAR